MRVRAALPLVSVLACRPFAAAREPAGVRRDPCDAATSRLELTMREAGGETVVWTADAEATDVETRQTFGIADAQRARQPTGSDVQSRRRGPWTVSIRAGFHDADPNGERGSADADPIVTAAEDGHRPLGRFGLGTCEVQNPRHGQLVPRPADWATRIFLAGSPRVRGTMLELGRANDERRLPAPETGSAREPTQPH